MPLAQSYEQARIQVEQLVDRFHRNLAAYKRTEYREEQVRVEFINPFFEALGWDVRNTKGYAEPYKDVIHEDAIRLGRSLGAPDYCFRIGGTRKFFLEAKKPSVSVQEDIGPAYQLRRYAWSAKLPLSILTDFEEFAVYDCQRRPKASDKADVARVRYVTYEEYLDEFEELYGTFARESVLKGSFDRYAQDTRSKRGTSEVDAEFLKEIEGWRDALARNIALRNPELTVYELNHAVQRTIDRILFLRMAEDRGIEGYGRLLALTNGPHIYPRLGDSLYRQADEKYNSGLFDFEADTLTRSLTIDDRVLKPILTGLYYPDCPYEFSVLPAEVLGQVYEQFLGKVIRLTPAHRAVVEEKPEVKKAGGVYYTPAYIVDYIVQQTVGQLVEGKPPRQLRGAGGKPPLRILDPACGSGSFLLGAYQYLLDHYRQWYEENDPQRYAARREPPVFQGPGGDWRLTTAEKKRILLDHIYGVDIDRQAVEVTKLSLLLKVLEGETDETLGQQLSFWRERALPDLDDNIKCGNSLIGPEYYDGRLIPDPEEVRRVNPFDWETEFPQVFPSPPTPLPEGEGSRRGEGQSGHKRALPPALLERVRALRRDATDAERFLWSLLRNRQLAGLKFRRQHPLAGYILDFYCHAARLGIELDGGQHAEPQQAAYDTQRTRDLESLGIKVLRFWNNEVLTNPEGVAEAILGAVDEAPHPEPLSPRERDSKGVHLPSPEGRGAGGEGGFDAVIGNPPYIRIQTMKEWAPTEVEFYKQAYKAASKGNYDIYVVFVERGLHLLNENGKLGYILPHKFFQAKYGEPLRGVLAGGQHLDQIIHFGDQQVFAGATTYTCLLFLDRAGGGRFRYLEAHDLDAWRLSGEAVEGEIPAEKVTQEEWNFVVGPGAPLFERLSEMPVKLGDVAHIFVGLQTSADTVFLFRDYQESTLGMTRVFSKELDRHVELESGLLKPVVRSGSIGRLWARPTALVLFPYRFVENQSQLIPESRMKRDYPNAWSYLLENKKLLSGRERGKFAGTGWYQLYPKNLDLWEQPKIMMPYMISELSAYYDEEDWYFVNVTTGGFGVTTDEQYGRMKYLAGLLNSRLMDWFMKNVSTNFRGGYLAANKQFLVQLPIHTIDFDDPADVARHDRLVALVECMLDLHEKLAAATIRADKTLYQRQIEATDRQIDALVYDLYDLTDEEIAIVEGAST